MGFFDITINEEQAKEIAKTIYADIDEYVNAHYDEYLAFCENEGYAISSDLPTDDTGQKKRTA